jgi:predicted DCC family thiol-disulfide oxidoreductase YuxK
MNELTVFYDETCQLCRRCRDWLMAQPTFVPLTFIPLHSPLLEERFPGISAYDPAREILVAGSDGSLYRGGSAWLMCLWATQTYREWSIRLAAPVLFPLVRRFCSLVSAHRLSLSTLLRKQSPEDVAEVLRTHQAPCTDGTCTP